MPGPDSINSSTSIGGFTGVVWQSRPTEKLAADLADGAGPAPLAEAGLAWVGLAEEFAQIGLEYSRILTDLGVHWESGTSNQAFEKLTRLSPWFADTAIKLVETGGRAETQAAANAVALAAMPSLPEIAVTKDVDRQLSQAGAALGAPIVAAAAKNDRIKHDLAQRAARVMESYERASAPVAEPWEIGKAPALVPGDALAAERAAAVASKRKPPATAVGSGAGTIAPIGGLGGMAIPPREKSRYAATSVASTESTATIPSPVPGDVQRTSSMVPPVAPMAAHGGQSDSTARPARSTSTDPEAGGVRLPEGWLSEADGSQSSWADVAEQMEPAEQRPMLRGEGVLNLGPTAPAVIGGSDEAGA